MAESNSWHVRPATPDESLDVRRLLDAAVLAFDGLDERIAAEDVLVATAEDGTIHGAVLLTPEVPRTRLLGAFESLTSSKGRAVSAGGTGSEGRAESAGRTGSEYRTAAGGAHVEAVAVRRRRRGRGMGTALVQAALEREGRLTAAFDRDLVAFYESLGFATEATGDDRFVGVATRSV